MRLRLGRPDVGRYSELFAVPAAAQASPVATTFLGVASVLFDDGESAIMTDGFFSRPNLLRVVARPIRPDAERIAHGLATAGVDRLDAVLPVHTHYDHALDSAIVAQRTGAILVGGESAANIGRGHGLPEDKIAVVPPGEPRGFGNYTITLLASEHCPPDRFPGIIDAPVPTNAPASAYRCGEAWSTLITHRPSGRTVLVQGSAGYTRGGLRGHSAEVAYLGVGQLGIQPDDYLREYWSETVRTVGAERVVLIHWDDFFRPLDRPLRAAPYAFDDLDITMRVFAELADADGVQLNLPSVFVRQDPWLALG